MSATRSRKEEKTYKAYLKTKPTGCTFCAVKKGDEQYIAETASFIIMRNIFPYSIWDGQRVVDHLMIIPKHHTESLETFTPIQAAEYLKLLNSYEQNGYNIYARAPSSVIKSIPHQHTHLIKAEGLPKKLLLLVRKPFYFRIST